MSKISRNVLLSKLNPVLYKSLESAFSYCRLRQNSYVELVHWLQILIQDEKNDLNLINKYFKVDRAQLQKDILAMIEKLPNGATNISDLSQHIDHAVEQSWTYTSLLFNSYKIRGAYLLYALLKSGDLSNVLFNMSHEFRKIKLDTLVEKIDLIIADSTENDFDDAPSVSSGDSTKANSNSALVKYGTNLTEMARNGEIDPIVGRENEIRQIIDILTRRRQNNPVLTGEAGVGKTAIVEALALRIAAGDVPPSLQNIDLVLLDMGALKAGASVSGEFESRLKDVMAEVESSTKPVVLFIDEIHTIVGAGGNAGTADAANLLKPALARGKLRTIGATTWAEYKKYFEKDPALTRRFQMILINEPTEDEAVEMLRGLLPSLEKHHKVVILDDAIVSATHLSNRYIPSRQLPDKAISLIDTACARVALSQHAVPSSIEMLKRKVSTLEAERNNLQREIKLEYDQQLRVDEIQQELDALNIQLTTESERWQAENDLVKELLDIRTQIMNFADKDITSAADSKVTQANISESDATTDTLNAAETLENGAVHAQVTASEEVNNQQHVHSDDNDAEGQDNTTKEMTLAELLVKQSELIAQLGELQKDNPLVSPLVDSHAIADVVSDWTGIPVGKMMKDELKAILSLSDTLNKRVIAQEHGIQAIEKRIQTSRANLDDPNKPIGVFMLAGPSGVGKTETALALADSLYGGEQNVITINMSEYQEAHTVSTLKGAPPGYVGYGEGGVLTEAVRRKPYSVVLLDEVEKAHPDVHEIFFQVFDKGWMEDGEGRYIDFKNTIIILTTNVGTNLIMDMCHDKKEVVALEDVQKALRKPMLEVFPAALLGRIQVIPYYPLSDDTIVKIVELQLSRIVKRIHRNHGIVLAYDESVLLFIASRCQEVESGGRMIDAILTNSVLPEISKNILSGIIEGEEIKQITLSVADNELNYKYEL